MSLSRLSLGALRAILLVAVGCYAIPARAEKVSAEQVELFAAMKAQQIDVKLVPANASQATVIIKNRTDRPLSIQLPAAFAGVPVLAQRNNDGGGGGGGNRGGNSSSSSSSQQTMGGGMMGGGMMGGMGMGGFFDVAPERSAKIKVATVCLEHGKDDPNPRVAYELKPITDFTTNPAVAEVCMLLGRGKLDQGTAQAAAWHLTDNLSWQDLARKIKVKHLNGTVEMYFNAAQLSQASQVVAVAREHAAAAADAARENSPGEQADRAAKQDSLSANN